MSGIGSLRSAVNGGFEPGIDVVYERVCSGMVRLWTRSLCVSVVVGSIAEHGGVSI